MTNLAGIFRLIALNIFVLACLAIILLIPIEAYYRIKHSDQPIDTANSFGYWDRSYPNTKEAIYKFKPGHYIRLIDSSEESFRVNQHGYREINFNPNKKVEVVLYGDSFTFGHGVSQGERFSDLVSIKRKNLNLANFAYNGGFTAPHYLLHFRITNHSPSRIYTFTYLGNDCQSDLNESKLLSYEEGGYPLRIIDKNGNITGDRSDYPPFVQVASKYSRFLKRVFTKLYASEYGGYFFSAKSRPNTRNSNAFDKGEDKAACRNTFRYLKELEKQCIARNATCKLVNLIIPQDFLVYNSETQANHTRLKNGDREQAFHNQSLLMNVMENCEKTGISCVNLTPLFKSKPSKRLYLAHDAHWNTDGHKLVAEWLLNDLQQ